jgi:hypothetical protein
MFFQKQIMHRSDAQIAEEQAKALAFFKQRFGLDPANGDVSISMFMFDPRNNYRAYVVSGEAVPSSGWVVRDGGWNATVTSRGARAHGPLDVHAATEALPGARNA